jgi:hypothetical protein
MLIPAPQYLGKQRQGKINIRQILSMLSSLKSPHNRRLGRQDVAALVTTKILGCGEGEAHRNRTKKRNVLGGWWAKLKFWVGDTAFMGLNRFHWEYEKRKDKLIRAVDHLNAKAHGMKLSNPPLNVPSWPTYIGVKPGLN